MMNTLGLILPPPLASLPWEVNGVAEADNTVTADNASSWMTRWGSIVPGKRKRHSVAAPSHLYNTVSPGRRRTKMHMERHIRSLCSVYQMSTRRCPKSALLLPDLKHMPRCWYHPSITSTSSESPFTYINWCLRSAVKSGNKPKISLGKDRLQVDSMLGLTSYYLMCPHAFSSLIAVHNESRRLDNHLLSYNSYGMCINDSGRNFHGPDRK